MCLIKRCEILKWHDALVQNFESTMLGGYDFVALMITWEDKGKASEYFFFIFFKEESVATCP